MHWPMKIHNRICMIHIKDIYKKVVQTKEMFGLLINDDDCSHVLSLGIGCHQV